MKKMLAAVLIVLLSASVASARRCFVVKTSPVNGARNVPVTLKNIEVTFNAPVKRNSYSFVRIKKGRTPDDIGQPMFVSPRVVRLPVALQARTKYSIGVNSARHRGFRLAADAKVSCKPHIISFVTGPETRQLKIKSPKLSRPVKALPKWSSLLSAPGAGVTLQAQNATGQLGQGGTGGGSGVPAVLMLMRYVDRGEKAFSCLVPRGWKVAGGIQRLMPNRTGGPFNAMEAKFNFWIFSPNRQVVMHWAPHWYYMDPAYNPILRRFVGRPYQGATVLGALSAVDFAKRVVFPRLHQGRASQVRLVEQRRLPRVAALSAQLNPATRYGVRYDAGIVKVSYVENGVRYLEIITVVTEYTGRLVAGLWTNRFTSVVRAPAGLFKKWAPVMAEINRSFRINPKWLIAEIKGRMKRQGIAAKTWAQIHNIGQQIVANRQKTNALINNHQYLTLTGRQMYTDPYTGKPIVGSMYYQRRWQDPNGNVIYTNNPGFDPGAGWKISEPRPITAD